MSNEKREFAAQDENGLSCALEAVGIASGVKSSDLSRRLNVDKDDGDVRPNGRLFQVLVAATQKVRSTTARHIVGTMSADADADRERCHESTSALATYDGATPCRQW